MARLQDGSVCFMAEAAFHIHILPLFKQSGGSEKAILENSDWISGGPATAIHNFLPQERSFPLKNATVGRIASQRRRKEESKY